MDRIFETSLDFAKKKDQEDSVAKYRDRFFLQPGIIYMDGNSLGLSSKDGEETLKIVNEKWKKYGVTIWNIEDGKYFLYQDFLGAKMAKLIGALPEEVTIMGSTTMNLHSAIATFYHPTKEKYKIIVDDLNFPTDRYAIDSQVKLHGLDVEQAVKVVPSPDGKLIDEDAMIEAMTDDVAMIILPTVLYRSAQIVDMKKITKAAHEKGIIVGWDLCHAIGAIEMDFSDIQPDFAVWCNYKYLNGGPGAIAGFYINKKHFKMEPGLAGWHGNKKETQFQLKQKFEHNTNNAGGWQTGTQPLLSMAPLEGSLSIFEEVGMPTLRKKSLDITAYLMFLADEKLAKYGFSVGNPREDAKRGGHVCLEHEEAYRICSALKEKNVIPDFREPNVIRLAPIALYTSYEDVYKLVEILEEIGANKLYEKFDNTRAMVV
ncbi:kynureninase [Neisseria montereyensis]|uniref:Kynureninase n=1 Tax=Neisseria montereyensis TaxID=2973938 RepID=A0ABT2F944_9NEIS|nr:kynureninase [Neisseria montereyensis]MCS4532704.1 kynureninase [Neisseria montereyensis]